MSIQTKLGKLISRFEIGFDDETKVVIDSLKDKLDEVTRALSVKNDSHGDRLLAAMQAEAANDAPQPELKELGQWVFEGQSAAKWLSASVDAYGDAFLSTCLSGGLEINKAQDCLIPKCSWSGHERKYIGHGFDATDWSNSTINRQPVNDVDYLTSSTPKQKGVPTFIAIDEYDSLSECVPHIDDVLDQRNWLSESIPQITQADMHLIFIKNLSETLIQRMHSMDRFSEDDYAIGGDKLMLWDIVVGKPYKTKEEDHNVVRFGVISCQSRDLKVLEVLSFNESYCNSRGESLAVYFSENNTYRTITEAELPAFRAALEACYA